MSQTNQIRRKIVLGLLKVSENPCWDGGILRWPLYPDELEMGIEMHVGRLVLLNAPVVGYKMYMTADRISWEVAKTVVTIALKKNISVLSYIGHESTAQLVSSMLGISVPANRGLYEPSTNDLALIFRLRGRPAKEVTDLKPEDIEILYIHYL